MAPGINTSLFPGDFAKTSKSTTTSDRSTLVLDHTSVTKDFDALKFEAAASKQLVLEDVPPATQSETPLSTLLVSSPYNEEHHLLDLTTLDLPNRLFAKALSMLQPIRPDYATAAYVESLNWATVLNTLRNLCATEGYKWTAYSFYVVIFRSKLKPVIDADLLGKLDFYSHREATESGGLLKYWFGTPNEGRRNLATCLWRSKEDARKGGIGPWHKKARSAARDLYAEISFSSYRFTVEDGAKDWTFEDWVD
ncbi:hypothetical protein AOQ84DRAFT_133773 [Glonium stellatum]|uniref:Uncharacterized protein n=1 Tax=Glonium stellatum TaxID=574774 RepID=A0A8E2JNV1_9PEZI|nr:hypothetical protein AOQ84DRAFT_133773 [Glonium stellatum]